MFNFKKFLGKSKRNEIERKNESKEKVKEINKKKKLKIMNYFYMFFQIRLTYLYYINIK